VSKHGPIGCDRSVRPGICRGGKGKIIDKHKKVEGGKIAPEGEPRQNPAGRHDREGARHSVCRLRENPFARGGEAELLAWVLERKKSNTEVALIRHKIPASNDGGLQKGRIGKQTTRSEGLSWGGGSTIETRCKSQKKDGL